MKRVWILQLKEQDCATGILFWRRFKKRCSYWVSGCLQRREKEVVDSITSYVKRSWKYVYWIINIKSLDFENNTLIDRNSFCRKSVFNLTSFSSCRRHAYLWRNRSRPRGSGGQTQIERILVHGLEYWPIYRSWRGRAFSMYPFK